MGGTNFNSQNEDYDMAANVYQDQMNQYQRNTDAAIKYYNDNQYDKSVSRQKSTATDVANTSGNAAGNIAGNQANTAQRNAGASKQSAAQSGANSAYNAAASTQANTYNNAYNSQQNASLSTDSNTLNAKMNSEGEQVNQRGNFLQAEQNEGNNKYNRAWGNANGISGAAGKVIGGIAQAVASDQNAKDYYPLSKADAILKKHKSYKDLMWKQGE